jgi:hypothetical protein
MKLERGGRGLSTEGEGLFDNQVGGQARGGAVTGLRLPVTNGTGKAAWQTTQERRFRGRMIHESE